MARFGVADVSPALDPANMGEPLPVRVVQAAADGPTRLELRLDALESCEKLRTPIRELRASLRIDTPLLIDGDLSTVLVLVRAIASTRGVTEVICGLLGAGRGLLEALPSKADGDVLMISEAQRLPEEDQHVLHLIADRGSVRPDGRRLGGRLIVHYDSRVPSALTSGGRFFRISVPRLRDHTEDAPMLLEHLLEQRFGDSLRLSDAARLHLTNQSWKGDVAELLQLADRLVFKRDAGDIAGVVEAVDVGAQEERAATEIERPREDDIKPGTLAAMMTEFEVRILRRTLEEVDWNKSAAARQLGISRSYLIQKCSAYGLEAPDAGWTWKRHREKAG